MTMIKQLFAVGEYPVSSYEKLLQQMPRFSLIGDDLIRYVEKVLRFGKVYVCDDGVLNGFIGYYANDFQGGIAYLSTIVVDVSLRGSGCASSLLNIMFEDCTKNGMTAIRANVVKTNDCAIRFYQKKGFRIIGRGRDEFHYEIERVMNA